MNIDAHAQNPTLFFGQPNRSQTFALAQQSKFKVANTIRWKRLELAPSQRVFSNLGFRVIFVQKIQQATKQMRGYSCEGMGLT